MEANDLQTYLTYRSLRSYSQRSVRHNFRCYNDDMGVFKDYTLPPVQHITSSASKPGTSKSWSCIPGTGLSQHLIYLLEETLRIGEAIVNGVGITRCIQYNSAGDRKNVIRLHELLIGSSVNIHNPDSLPACLQNALQRRSLELMAVVTIIATEGENAYWYLRAERSLKRVL